MLNKDAAFTYNEMISITLLAIISGSMLFLSVYGAICFYENHIQKENTPIINNITVD